MRTKEVTQVRPECVPIVGFVGIIKSVCLSVCTLWVRWGQSSVCMYENVVAARAFQDMRF